MGILVYAEMSGDLGGRWLKNVECWRFNDCDFGYKFGICIISSR